MVRKCVYDRFVICGAWFLNRRWQGLRMEAAMNVLPFFASLLFILLPGLSSGEEFPRVESKKGLQVEIARDQACRYQRQFGSNGRG